MSNNEFPVALFILRLGLGVFLLLFGIDKLVAPITTVEVFTLFYGLVVSHGMIYAAGALEILLGLAFLAGLWKTQSYGLGLLVHAVSTLATYQMPLSPFGTNHLFLAAVPVLAAFITLFLLRRHDTLWSMGKRAREPMVRTHRRRFCHAANRAPDSGVRAVAACACRAARAGAYS